jgi:hypothetical protein
VDYCNELCVRRSGPTAICPVCDAWQDRERFCRQVTYVPRVLGQWIVDLVKRLRSPRRYTLLVALVGAYFGLYAIFEARHERQMNRALFERSTFMTMVTSDKRGAFVAAMKQFGPVQTIRVPADPEWWPPFYRWCGKEQPNLLPLWQWARHFLASCTLDYCGVTDQDKHWRIDLREATLRGATLGGATWHEVDLSEPPCTEPTCAELSCAGLTYARLTCV